MLLFESTSEVFKAKPSPAATFAPLALIFTLSPSLTISTMFVPASSLSFKASAVTPFDVWLITDFNASSLTLNVNLELPSVAASWLIFKYFPPEVNSTVLPDLIEFVISFAPALSLPFTLKPTLFN